MNKYKVCFFILNIAIDMFSINIKLDIFVVKYRF